MFKRHKTLGIYLILAALFASSAQAVETIMVDPGTVGGSAQPLSFSVTVPSTGQVDLVFTDNKTLTFGPGEQKFRLAVITSQGFPYEGVLLDEFGEEIPGTEFAGIANVSDANLGLEASTVWSGMRFTGVFFLGAYELLWIPQPNVPLPEVGDTTGNKPPKADADGPYSGVLFAPVTFDGSASFDPDGGEIAQYDWYFGEDEDSVLIDAGPNPNYTYNFQANTYWVVLTVTDEDGTIDSVRTTAAIGTASAPPMADDGGPYTGTAGEDVTFDGTDSYDPDGGNLSYLWSFGDVSVDSGPMPTHTYTADGKYPVILEVTDVSGEETTDVTVAAIGIGNLPPSADAGEPVTGVVGEPVSFDGSASKDPDGDFLQYDWDYDDGNNDIDAGPTPSHTYDTAKVYTVTLTVTDEDGTSVSSFTTADIAEDNQPPVADAKGPYTGDVGVAVDFDGTNSSDQDGTILAQVWDFGDDDTGVGDTVSHAYAEAGEYDVVLIVIDEDGGIAEDRTTATIGSDNEPPLADANGPYPGIVDAPVRFDGTASDDPDGDDIATYAWDFGDDTLGSGAQPEHTYLETGVYDVTLTVTDVDGGTDVSVTKAVIGDGNLPPVADVGGPYRGRADVAVVFDGSASFDPDGTTIATYEWDFGDDSQGGSETLEHTYTAAGFYHVTLTVTDDDGAKASDSTLVRIGAASVPPVADARGPYIGTPGITVNFDGTGSSDSDSAISTWAWDFGDTTFGTGATAQHAYSASGTYIVTLTVTDSSGETDIDLTTALIGEGSLPPVADAGGPYWAAAGALVKFDGTGSRDLGGSGIATYAWDFGDGMTGSGPTTSHTYTSDDRYNVTLTVTDNNSVSDSAGTTAVVGASPPNTLKDDVVVNFGSLPLFSWMNDGAWLKLNNNSPDRVTTGDMDGNGVDDVIADFTSTLGGIFVKYNLGGWTQLANPAAEQMTSGDLDNNGQDDVVIDFGASLGLWARMNNTSWLKLNNASPEQVVVGDMDNSGGDDVIGDFGAGGIFVKRNLGEWVKLHNSNPEGMTIGNLDGTAGDDLVVDFAGSLGLQARMNDSSWLKLHNETPDVMTTGDIDGNGADDVLAGFANTVGGFWAKINLGGWTQQNPNSPEDVVSADITGNGEDDIMGDFGNTIGGLFVKRDQGGWVKLHNTSPDSMAPGELD